MEIKKTTKGGDFVSTDNAKVENTNKQKKVKKTNKKPNFLKRIAIKIKEIFFELKNVNWPSFMKVVKQTGIVLVVVLLFLVVITAFDTGLTELLKLIQK